MPVTLPTNRRASIQAEVKRFQGNDPSTFSGYPSTNTTSNAKQLILTITFPRMAKNDSALAEWLDFLYQINGVEGSTSIDARPFYSALGYGVSTDYEAVDFIRAETDDGWKLSNDGTVQLNTITLVEVPSA